MGERTSKGGDIGELAIGIIEVVCPPLCKIFSHF